LFRRRGAPLIGSQSKLTLDRGLHTGPIEDFAFNLGGRQRLSTHRFHQELIALVFAQMLGRADDNARAKEKLLFGSSHPGTVPLETRPIRVLPVPCHER
jgi:hypothetical protein